MDGLRLTRTKECRTLTWRGWLLASVVGFTLCATLFQGIYPFLAITDPVGGEILVVEGWLPDYALEQIVSDYQTKGYELVATTGGPIDHGRHLTDLKNGAELAAASLRALGLPGSKLEAIPSEGTRRDRTYTSALAVKNWLMRRGKKVAALDVYTLGAHARRTRLMFRMALGPDIAVGVVALPYRDLPTHQWWSTSEGVRDVLSETIVYVYARVLFHPG